ncbi:toxin glutamine deamidase domain-containing protein [Nonomuraea sp. NPDC050202]|uniref:toxin glutamine deamidase domain-containing protein n=1 Tax=Nonomuraea sp. NPDC050202 TaxID=3155035 RepID=UPI00340513BD
MAGRTDVNDARKPAGSAHAFDGGIATEDVEPVWQTEALPGWVVHHLIPLLTAGQSWPKGSESKLWELRVEYVKLMNLLIGTLDPTAATVQTLNGSLQSPAKPAIFKRLATLSDDKVGVVAKAQESFSYAKMVDNFARETQYSKLSVNVAFWVAVIAAFIALIAAGFVPLASLLLRSVGAAGASRIALIMQRLALAASRSGTVAKSGQITKLAGTGAGAGNKFFNAALAAELFEEISEEVFIDAFAQYQQIKMGTRDSWDWKKIKAAAIGAGAGAVAGTKLGGPMSRYTNNLPGISRLNRIAGDNRGVRNAFLRFPGRALNTGLNNMIASPVGSVVANYVVYDQFSLPGEEGMYGGFLGGAGRTNTISPFNPSVAGAIVNPMTSLSGVLDDALAAQQGGPGTAGTPGAGLADGGSPVPAGPRPELAEGTAAANVPPQRPAFDLSGPSAGTARRDNAAAIADPVGSQPEKRTQAAPAPDLTTPNPNQTSRPAPQQEEKPDTQNQAEDQDTADQAGQASRPSRQEAPPTDQQSATTADRAPGDSANSSPAAQQTADTPEQTAAREPAGTQEAPNAPQPTRTADPANASEPATPPEPPATAEPTASPEPAGAPKSADVPQPTGAPVNREEAHQNASTPDILVPSEAVTTTTGTTAPAEPQSTASPAPGQERPGGDPAPGLVTRLIRTARQSSRGVHALVAGRPIRNTRFVANGRARDVPPLTVAEARAAFEVEVLASDLGDTVTGLRWTGAGTLVVELDGLPDQTFVFEVGPVRRGRLGRTVLRDGGLNEVRLAPRVTPDQVARLVLHEIADTLHARNHPQQSLLRRLSILPGTQDECLAARRREEAFLTRRMTEVSAAERDVLKSEREAVRRILDKHGLPYAQADAPPASPSPVPPSVADQLTRLRGHEQAIGSAVQDLGQALAGQIDRLLRIEMDLQLRAMSTAGTGTAPLLLAVSQARAAYEAAQQLLHTATGSSTPVTAFARALHTAHQLYLRFEEQSHQVGALPRLPDSPPGPDLLRQHIAALRAAADDLTSAAQTSPGTIADQHAAAASAISAANVYELLLDRMTQAGFAPPSVLVSQLLRLGGTYEQHFRQATAQEQVASDHGAQNINKLHAALLGHVSARQGTVAMLRSTIEQFDAVVDAQRRAVRAYNESAGQAYALAAEAMADGELDRSDMWRTLAADLGRIGARQEVAEQLAVAARDAHQQLANLLEHAVDPVQLNAQADAATTALLAYQEEIARLPPATPPNLLPSPAPHSGTALSLLRQEIDDWAEDLRTAWRHNADLGLQHRQDAMKARADAVDAWKLATEHAAVQDSSAAERVRKAEAEAELKASTAAGHTQLAELYQAAAEAAKHALQAAEQTLDALDEVNTPDSPMTSQVESALNELGTRAEAFATADRATLPSMKALTGAHVAGPIANLDALTAMVNDMLEQQGVAALFTEQELRYAIRQAFRTAVSPDGMILRLNTATGAELRIRLKLDDLREVARPNSTHSETMIGQLPQGGGQTSTTAKFSRGFSFDKNMMPVLGWMLHASGVPVPEALLRFTVLNLKAAWSDSRSASTSALDNWLRGNVEDNRGTATMFSARASWEVELRTTSGNPVTRVLPPAGNARQGLWISHAYLTGPPESLIQLPEAERQRRSFPGHVVTGLTGLARLADQVMEQLEGVGLSPVARGQIITTLTEDLPSHLGEAVNDPLGLRRAITVNGRVRAVMTVRTRVLAGGEPVGVPSNKHHQERLRNGTSNPGQSQSGSHNKNAGVEAGVNLNPRGGPRTEIGADLAPKATTGVESGRSATVSTSVNGVAIHPSVQRWAGHTQGYELTVEHTVTIQVLGKGSKTVTLTSEPGTGLFRIPESDAYRYGLPVDAAAEVGLNPDGTLLLRGDPVRRNPPGRVGALPVWLGSDPGQTRGAGPALVQQVTGMASVRAQVEEFLRAQGVLPELKNGVPSYSKFPLVRASQIANEQLVAEQFSAERLEAGYDQAAQEGLFINLVQHQVGRGAQHYTLRIKLEQHFDQVAYEGVTDAEPVVNLDIGSDTYSSTVNRGKSWKAPGTFSPESSDLSGVTALNAKGGYGRGHQHAHTTSSTVNQVKLVEGSGLTAVFRVPHTIRVDLLTGSNVEKPVVEEELGDARVLLPADLLPLAPAADGQPRPESPRHPTSERAMRLATIAHLDVGDIAAAAANLLANPPGRDSPQFQHLSAFFNVRSLISHPEVFSSGHRAAVHTTAALRAARHQPVSLTLTPGESRFLSAVDLVVGDINLTLGAHGSSAQGSRSVGFGAGTGVPLPVPGEPGSDEGLAGSGATTTTREQKVIAGPERLAIDTGKQYAFAMGVTPNLTVGSGAGARTITQDDGTVVYLLAERDALDLYASGEVELPLHQVADAAERLMNGNLDLGRRVAIRFMDRYLHDLAQARAENGSWPTVPGVPLTSGHDTHRALARLLELFPDARLTELMHPDVPPGQPGEEVAETRDRMLSSPDFYQRVWDGLRADAQRLENGDVPAQLAPTYSDSIGMSTVKQVDLHPADDPGAEVDLLEEVMAAVDDVAPGALDRDPELLRALTTDFSRQTWLGKIDNMLDPDWPGSAYTVRVPGSEETLQITVRAELTDDVAYRGDVHDYGQIFQMYTMLEENASESASTTVTPDFKATETAESAAATIDRGGTHAGASNMQHTRVQRVAAMDGAKAEVRQGIRLSIEVSRSTDYWVAPGLPLVVSDQEAAARSGLPQSVIRHVAGTIDRIIPAGMVSRPGTVPAPVPAVPDPRPIPAPENFTVETTRVTGLAKAVEQRLKDTLDVELGPEDSQALARLLSGNFRNALFERMTAKDGHMVIQVPKGDGKVVRIRLGAVLSEPIVMSAGRENTEIGQVDRRQWTTRASADGPRWLPVSASVGSNEDNSWFPLNSPFGMAFGYLDQTTDGLTVSGGNRDETSVFEKADGSSVRFRVDYHVGFEVWSDPDTDQTPERTVAAQRIATGNADVILFDGVMQAVEKQAESLPAVASPHEQPVQSTLARPRSLAGLLAADHHELAATLSSEPDRINLDADLPGAPYGQLRQAQLASRELGRDVQVTVRLPSRRPLTYIATPDGRLHPQTQDGDFGQRFAGLPTLLITMAEQHHIDLHALHQRTSADAETSLAEQLRRELNRRAVLLPAATPGWPVNTTPDDRPPGGTNEGSVTHGSPDPDSNFIPDGRTSPEDLTEAEARSLSEPELIPQDLGDAVTAITWLSDTQLIVQHQTLGELHFTVQVGPVKGGYLGETRVRHTAQDGSRFFEMTLAPRVHEDQVARLVLHEISDVIQHQLEKAHTHTPGRATLDACVTARRNELRFLQRRHQAAQEAGNTALADRLAQEIAAVERDLAKRTGSSQLADSIDHLINFGPPGEAETPGNAGDEATHPAELAHATRTPQLNMNPATWPGEQLANSYDPRKVPWAPHWEHLRDSAAPIPVTPPSGAAHLEVRRLLVPWQGSMRPVTEFTLQVLYRADPGVGPDEIATAHASLLNGIDLYYNYQHELPDGSQLHVRVEFVPAPDSAPPDNLVLLWPGTGDRAVDFADRQRWYGNDEVISTPLEQLRNYAERPMIHYLSWYAQQEPIVFAHEVMHLLGMSDEYVSRWAGDDRNRLGASGVHADATLLGSALLFWSEHDPILDRDGRAVAGISSLRDRHVEHIYGLVPDSAVQPKVPLHRPAAPADGAEWTHPEYLPSAFLPRDVRSLLDAFPPGDRPLLAHLRLLERMAGIFPLVSPLLAKHLEYTDTLVRTAQQLYNAGPEYSFSLSDLVQLKNLFDLLGPFEVPDLHLLHQEINSLLRRPASTPVGNRLVQDLVTFAASVEPQSREATAATLHTAAIKELRRLGSALHEALDRGDAEAASDLTRAIEAAAELAHVIEAVLKSTGVSFDQEHIPYAHLSDTVRGLLEDFPPGSRPLLDHVRRLHRMAALYQDVPQLTQQHLERTDTFVLMAQELYNASHEERLGTYEIGNVKVLSDVLLGDVMPDGGLLREQLNPLLGRHPSAPADRQAIEKLAWYAGYVAPRTGETGPARLLEGIAIEVAELEDELLDAQQSGDTAEAESLTHRIEAARNWARVIEAAAETITGEPSGNAGDESGFTHGAPIPDSEFVADGRTTSSELTEAEARRSFEAEVISGDLGDAVTGITWVSDTKLVVQHTTLGELHFTVEVGPVEGGYLGRTTVEGVAGDADNPHVMTLAPRVHEDQVARLVLHEISDVIQYRLATAHPHQHKPGEATLDECVTGRRNELRFLQRKHQAALAAGNTTLAKRLADEITAVERDLAERTRPAQSIDDVINGMDAAEPAPPEVQAEPEPIGANLSKVTLNDDSPALLLEHSTRRERDLHLLMAQLAGRLGLIANARASGDRNILIDWAPTSDSSGFLGTREAVLTGYLVAVADATPFVTEPAFHLLPSSTPILELFLREDASGERTWLSNPLSPLDVQTLRTMLEDLRPEFAELGLLPEFDRIMARHESLAGGLLAPNAAGGQSVVTAAPGQLLHLGHLDRLRVMDEHPPSALDIWPAPQGEIINAAHRLRNNIRHGVLEKRDTALGRVLTFADGSQALQIPLAMTAQVLVRALVRQALGLEGPAVHIDEETGGVWRTYGSNDLRVSLATGIAQVIGTSGRATEVVFVDGRRALRHEFLSREAADDYEARLEEAREVADGMPGSYRSTPFVLFEEIVAAPEPTAEAQARLATRALYALLSHDRPLDRATLRRLLDANPLLVQFGEAFDYDFRAGAPVLAARDVADLTARFEALRGVFDRLGLRDHYERMLNTLSRFTGTDDTRLIPLALSETLATTAEYRVPAWRPPSGPVLRGLLQNDHLAQVHSRLVQARALHWADDTRELMDVISRADAELAELPSAGGYVYAIRVPRQLIRHDIRPGEGFAADTLLDGVDDVALLAETSHSVRVTILASGYVPVGDLSGKSHHAAFRAGTLFTVTAMLHTDDGETHYFLTQNTAHRGTQPVVTPTTALTPDMADALAPTLHDAVSDTRAGVHVDSGLDHDTRLDPRPAGGAFVVEGRYSEQGMMVGGRPVSAEVIAAMLLNSPRLPPDAAILLTGPHDGTTTFAQDLARYTNRIVLAAGAPFETTPLGNLYVSNAGPAPGDLQMFPPADTSAAAAQQLRAWLAPALPAAGMHPSIRALAGEASNNHLLLSELRPRGLGLLPWHRQLTETEEELMQDAYRRISRILEEAGGRALRLDEVRSLLPYINPLDRKDNCAEVALAVDDILSGRPAVAGLIGNLSIRTAGVYSSRAIQQIGSLTATTLHEVEELIRRNPGSRGLVSVSRAFGAGHAYNIVNIDGRLFYLDGQSRKLESANMHVIGCTEYTVYRTA